jgi:sugar phosphate isomerase/epimerase
MKITGIGDEAGNPLSTQIKAAKELGWDSIEARNVQVGDFPNGNLHEIPEEAFELAAAELESAGIGVCAFGSAIGNWAHTIDGDFQITLDEIGRAIPRMQRLGSKFVRIMSYAICQDESGNDLADQMAPERFRRVREINQRFADAGITCVHENCMNYGGMGPAYALELLGEVPGLKWVFDTGNPVFNRDRTKGDAPIHPMQDVWEFYEAVKDAIVHVHIKDGIWHEDQNEMEYTWPADGHGDVKRILADLKARNYQGYLSIEPHMAVVFHDTPGGSDSTEQDAAAKAAAQYENYLEYGHRMAALVR